MGSSGRQALTVGQRRAAFWAVTVIVVGVVALTSLSGGSKPSRGAVVRAASTRPAPRIADAFTSTSTTSDATPNTTSTSDSRTTATTSATSTTTATSTTSGPAPRPIRSSEVDRRLVLAHARRFLAAYLVYEVAPLDARMRAALRQTTTVAFANRLLKHTIRLRHGERSAVGTVKSIELGGDPDSSSVTADATVDHAGWVSGLILDFTSTGRRWLVSGLS